MEKEIDKRQTDRQKKRIKTEEKKEQHVINE